MALSLNCFPSHERSPSVRGDHSPKTLPLPEPPTIPFTAVELPLYTPPCVPFYIPGITQLTGYIEPVLCYRADRQRRSHCSPNLPALHIQVEPKQTLSHIALGHLGQQLPGKGQKGEARQDAGLTRRPSPALPASILLLKTPIHIFRTGPPRRHGLYVEQRTM